MWDEVLMDSITEMIKAEIRSQYNSVLKFSEETGIPYTTLTNALNHGIGGTAYDTIVKIFQALDIRRSSDDDMVLFSRKFLQIYEKLIHLDEKGIHTFCTLLNAEYARCKDEDRETAGKDNLIG